MKTKIKAILMINIKNYDYVFSSSVNTLINRVLTHKQRTRERGGGMSMVVEEEK